MSVPLPSLSSALLPALRRGGTPGPASLPLAAALSPERADLVLTHLSVADALAQRFRRARREWGDLQQVARLGLIKAAVRFRLGEENSFVSYAAPTISGELKRYLRDYGWTVRPPRRIQELHLRISATEPELVQGLGRAPTARELARHLDEDEKSVCEALRSNNHIAPDSLDAPNPWDDGTDLADTLGGGVNVYDQVDDLVSLGSAIAELTAWERRLLYLRFYEEKKQQEIANELGISQMQVSRMLAALLGKLRKALAG